MHACMHILVGLAQHAYIYWVTMNVSNSRHRTLDA